MFHLSDFSSFSSASPLTSPPPSLSLTSNPDLPPPSLPSLTPGPWMAPHLVRVNLENLQDYLTLIYTQPIVHPIPFQTNPNPTQTYFSLWPLSVESWNQSWCQCFHHTPVTRHVCSAISTSVLTHRLRTLPQTPQCLQQYAILPLTKSFSAFAFFITPNWETLLGPSGCNQNIIIFQIVFVTWYVLFYFELSLVFLALWELSALQFDGQTLLAAKLVLENVI